MRRRLAIALVLAALSCSIPSAADPSIEVMETWSIKIDCKRVKTIKGIVMSQEKSTVEDSFKERQSVTPVESPVQDAAVPGEPAENRLAVTAARADTRVRILSEGNKTIVDVRSRFGIDTATITRQSNGWPEAMLVRLHLKGLESFKVASGPTAIEWSVSSTDASTKRVSLHKGTEESSIDDTSPYYSEVRISGVNDTIPIEDGYFEIPLPSMLLQGNQQVITLHWIDFYRG